MTSRRLSTTYRQTAPIAQYVRIIDAQIAVRFCAICSIYILPKALDDILTVSILIGGCVFYLPRLCVPPFCRGAMWVYTHGKMAAHASLANKKMHPPINT